MVAVLTRLFGADHINLAEDVVQESFVKALSSWKINGTPDQPEAWLMRVAKNAAIDLLRREKNLSSKLDQVTFQGTHTIPINQLFLKDEIEDAQLRMIFSCCDPAIKTKDQIAITLKIVSGFSNKEIANALFQKEDAVKKRIQRAKSSLKSAWTNFEVPQGKALRQRLDSVLHTIYLIFNEGYHSSSHESITRQELCYEAMRLGHLICLHKAISQPKAFALLGLMCFHAARIESRFNQEDEIVLFAHQDRSKWNYDLINQGHYFMNLAVNTDNFSNYHIEAAILFEYMRVKTFDATNWSRIIELYEQLYELQPSPFIVLNKTVVHIYAGELKVAQGLLDKIPLDQLMSRKYMWYAVQAKLYSEQGLEEKSKQAWEAARRAAPTEAEKRLFEKNLR